MFEDTEELEERAISKYPRRGKCPQSCFANGWHRVGRIPMYSLMDGAAPGISAMGICIECGQQFPNDSGFYPRAQPSVLGMSMF